ncbi:unnamed protein product [Zymoseptoria tritici ST99CH_1E4]|uniref:Uncharacterized protein n=1 Tax=Zymoseptoria tritici ST99CH_1E4 TaxID=1276532 RepID=A0A2H1H4Y5_ZYMTR|nr:unnamed protein product [Zymoseptoria tritici ST99CH_1E4]
MEAELARRALIFQQASCNTPKVTIPALSLACLDDGQQQIATIPLANVYDGTTSTTSTTTHEPKFRKAITHTFTLKGRITDQDIVDNLIATDDARTINPAEKQHAKAHIVTAQRDDVFICTCTYDACEPPRSTKTGVYCNDLYPGVSGKLLDLLTLKMMMLVPTTTKNQTTNIGVEPPSTTYGNDQTAQAYEDTVLHASKVRFHQAQLPAQIVQEAEERYVEKGVGEMKEGKMEDGEMAGGERADMKKAMHTSVQTSTRILTLASRKAPASVPTKRIKG